MKIGEITPWHIRVSKEGVYRLFYRDVEIPCNSFTLRGEHASGLFSEDDYTPGKYTDICLSFEIPDGIDIVKEE